MSDIVQGTEAWKILRSGKVTASRISDVMAKTKTGWGASRANYQAELIAERLTGVPMASYTNAAMQWGTDTEPQARLAYSFRTDHDVEQTGFAEHPTISMSGASPDGLIGTDGLVELKCPQTSTHIDTLLGTPIPSKYVLQMQWQMACTGRSWVDFVSFDPRLPESMRLFIARVNRDDEKIEELEENVKQFLVELEQKVEALKEKYE